MVEAELWIVALRAVCPVIRFYLPCDEKNEETNYKSCFCLLWEGDEQASVQRYTTFPKGIKTNSCPIPSSLCALTSLMPLAVESAAADSLKSSDLSRLPCSFFPSSHRFDTRQLLT